MPESRIWEAFNPDISESLELQTHYNITPSRQVPIIRDTKSGREMVMAKLIDTAGYVCRLPNKQIPYNIRTTYESRESKWKRSRAVMNLHSGRGDWGW